MEISFEAGTDSSKSSDNLPTLSRHLPILGPVSSPWIQSNKWTHAQLTQLLAPLVAKWQKAIGVELTHCGIKKMKTRWGTCNSAARRIWVNLELAKKPIQCLEYIVVHELVHLLVRHHDERFVALMNQHLPHWRTSRAILNAEPLAHEDWRY